MQHRGSGEDRVGFRLSEEYLRRLEDVAAAARVSRHQMARDLLVMSLTGVSQEELLVAISEISLNVTEVHERLAELTVQQIRLTHNLAAAVEWLSLTIADSKDRAIDSERLHEVVMALFFAEEPAADLTPSQEVRG